MVAQQTVCTCGAAQVLGPGGSRGSSYGIVQHPRLLPQYSDEGVERGLHGLRHRRERGYHGVHQPKHDNLIVEILRAKD